MSTSSTPPTTAAVRLAWPGEAPVLAALQRRAWADRPEGRALTGVSPEAAAEAWHHAIVAPPMAHFRVLVAHEADGQVAAFAAIGPADDPDAEARDAEVAVFVVDEAARGRGHGSRLLNALVDTMRADGYLRATWWVATTDDALREFLASSGWAPDGAHRDLGTEDDALHLKQVRLHTDISVGED